MVAAIGSQRIAQDAAALLGDAPTPRSWDFVDQTTDVETFEEAAHGGAVALSFRGAGMCGVNGRADVFVAEPLGNMVILQYRCE